MARREAPGTYMALTWNSTDHRVRGYAAGSRIETTPVTSLDAPTVAIGPQSGRELVVTVTALDPRADWVEIYLDADSTPTTLVAVQSWYSLDPVSTGDIGEGATRYVRARAVTTTADGPVYSAYSAVTSATTQAAIPAPGAPFGLVMTNNNNGTANLSWSNPDSYATEQQAQIWRQSDTSWVVLEELSASATSLTGVAIPGSTGATPNASGEYGVRIRRANSSGTSWSNQQWVPVTSGAGAGAVTAGQLGTVVVVSSSSLRIPLAVAPTNYTSLQLQRSLTGGSGAGSWANVAGADAESDFSGGGYLDTGRSAATQYYYRLAVSDGVTTVYSNVVSGITQSAGGAGLLFFDSLANGFDSRWGVGSAWSAQSGFARCSYNGEGTAKYQLTMYLNNFGARGIREFYIAFDIRHPAPHVGTPKTLKFFGIRDGASGNNYSNVTFNNGYQASYQGVAYGNAPGDGPHDSTEVLRFSGAHILDRSTSPMTLVSRSGNLPLSTSWRRFKWYFRQNSAAGVADGEVYQITDGVVQMHVKNILNRGNSSQGFEYFTFGDYTQAAGSFQMEIRNVAFSTTQMPD